MEESVLILSIGGGAGQIIQAGHQSYRESKQIQWASIDTDIADLDFLDGIVKIPLGIDWLPGDGTGGNSIMGAQSVGAHTNDIIELIKNCKTLVLVACLGGGTAGGGLVPLLKIAKKEKKPVISIVTTPLKSEGSAKTLSAEVTLEQLYALETPFVQIKMERLLEGGSSKQFDQALKFANRELSRSLFHFAGSILSTKGMKIKIADFRNLLQSRESESLILDIPFTGADLNLEEITNYFDAHPRHAQFLKKSHILLAILAGPNVPDFPLFEAMSNKVTNLGMDNAKSLFGIGENHFTKDPYLTIFAIHYDQNEDINDSSPWLNAPMNLAGEVHILDTQLSKTSQWESTSPLGVFANTMPTEYQGVNLDIPTFIRQKIIVPQPIIQEV
ncbi:MAG: hypothetical protein MK193_11745 [Lentisphaeria bacterium]|nr:hypothetical protein [Lentisphaeria bacterium]